MNDTIIKAVGVLSIEMQKQHFGGSDSFTSSSLVSLPEDDPLLSEPDSVPSILLFYGKGLA
jgi:hypothetical protein